MSCLGRAAVPVKRVWRGLGKSSSSSYYATMDWGSASDGEADGVGAAAATVGLGRLRKEVRTCEYSDVHVMWEMLSSSSSKSISGGGARAMAGADASAGRKGSRRGRVGRKAAVAWSRLASYCCAL